jgi:hypothetical protein
VIVSNLTSGSGVKLCELAVVVGAGSRETETDWRETAAFVDLAEMGAILNGFGSMAILGVGIERVEIMRVGKETGLGFRSWYI